jgi:hypothetical protein
MKLKEKDPEEFVQMGKKISDAVGIDGLTSMIVTLLGVSNNICKFLFEERGITNLSHEIKYSLLQCSHILVAVSAILNSKEKVSIGGYFPIDEDAWKSEEDFEKRLIILVKLIYEYLKKEGKI